jgi:hypothetical protein
MQYVTPENRPPRATNVTIFPSLHSIRRQQLFIHRHLIDALLGKFERGKENSVDDARA